MKLQRTKKVDALTLLSMVDGPWRRAETNPAKFGVWGKVSEESTTVSGDARIPSHHGAKQVCVQLFFTSADNVASPTTAAVCRVAARCCERREAAAVDRYLMPARRSAANSPQQHAVIGEGWDGQTAKLWISMLFMHGRQFRVLWFTCRREYCKCRESGRGSDVGEAAGGRQARQRDGNWSDYWQRRLNVEESTGAFLAAIATLIEDTLEITLQLYIIVAHGVQENIVGQYLFSPRDAHAALMHSAA